MSSHVAVIPGRQARLRLSQLPSTTVSNSQDSYKSKLNEQKKRSPKQQQHPAAPPPLAATRPPEVGPTKGGKGTRTDLLIPDGPTQSIQLRSSSTQHYLCHHLPNTHQRHPTPLVLVQIVSMLTGYSNPSQGNLFPPRLTCTSSGPPSTRSLAPPSRHFPPARPPSPPSSSPYPPPRLARAATADQGWSE